MKKITLKEVNLGALTEFLSRLTDLNSVGSVFFKLTPTTLETSAHNEEKVAVKAISIPIENLCNKHNIEDTIKLGFYEGKLLLKQLSVLSGNEVTIKIDCVDMDGQTYMEKMNISSGKTTMKFIAADYLLYGFDNVSDETMEAMTKTDQADCEFTITSTEIAQIHKMVAFDNEEEILITINDNVTIGTKDNFDMGIDDTFGGAEGTTYHKISKKLFKLIDVDTYTVYPMKSQHRLNFKSQTANTDIILMVHEEIN